MTDYPITAGQAADRLPLMVRQRFQSGDLEALGEVYNAYAGPVHAVARGILHFGGQADDAVQETFMRAWRGAASLDPNRPLGPWLFTIARRAAIDIVRKEAKPTRSGHQELPDEVGVDLPGIEDAWERWQVRLALEELPEEERVVMMLSHYQRLTQVQIAAQLDVPIGTVKSRSHRGHRRLAVLLKHLDAVESEESE